METFNKVFNKFIVDLSKNKKIFLFFQRKKEGLQFLVSNNYKRSVVLFWYCVSKEELVTRFIEEFENLKEIIISKLSNHMVIYLVTHSNKKEGFFNLKVMSLPISKIVKRIFILIENYLKVDKDEDLKQFLEANIRMMVNTLITRHTVLEDEFITEEKFYKLLQESILVV